MKKSYLFALLGLLAATPALSQERPRYFDNFDTAGGVHVKKANYVQTPAKTGYSSSNLTNMTPGGNTKVIGGKRYLMPTSMSAPTLSSARSKIRMANMAVSEGLSNRETQDYVSRTVFSMGTNSAMKGYTTGNPVFDSYIVDSSRRYNVDPLLIYSQMHQESSFKLKATSNKGASGLMQLMPATARRLGVSDIYDPKQNIEGGVKYMRMLLNMFGQDVNLALAGYNAGEGAVMRFGNSIPPFNETREYVRHIGQVQLDFGSVDPAHAPFERKVAARLIKNEAPPLTITQNAISIKLSDGRMRLVN